MIPSLILHYYPILFRYASFFTKDQKTAKEITQDALEHLWEQKPLWGKEKELRNFLHEKIRMGCYKRYNQKVST
ncbi:MAG TPA: sigma factor [Chitinophagaceae bacterium]|nr:sigma factor [Chitinophagaceae bacterium]